MLTKREVTKLSHNEDDETSNLYTRLKENLRKLVDSAVTWTPWVKTYAKKGRAKRCDYTIHVLI
jgi:hypothetical protein